MQLPAVYTAASAFLNFRTTSILDRNLHEFQTKYEAYLQSKLQRRSAVEWQRQQADIASRLSAL